MCRHTEGFLYFKNIKSLQGYKRNHIFIDVYEESNYLPCVTLIKFTHAQQHYVQVLHTEFHKVKISHRNILTPLNKLQLSLCLFSKNLYRLGKSLYLSLTPNFI
jgi:hypothetical protein